MMKVWGKYTNYLLSGEWHIHTSHTDGENSIAEYCQEAVKKGIPLLAFTEHVRRSLDYNFRDFLNEIEQVRAKFDLIILSGCETKVLPDSELDVEEWVLQEVDYPVFAFHSFPNDIGKYLKSLETVLNNNQVSAWAHPGLLASKYGLNVSDKKLIEIFELMNQNDVLLEVNSKYGVLPKRWLDLAKNHDVKLVRGGDIHCVSDIVKPKIFEQSDDLISSNKTD